MSKRLLKLMTSCIISCTLVFSSSALAFAESDTTNSYDNFEQAVLSHMENRETTFTVNYTGDYQSFSRQVSSLINQAVKGDEYLNISLLSERINMSNSNGNTAVTLNVQYVETKDQIAFVDQKVDEIVSKVVTADMTTQQKIKALHDYVCSITSYDDSLSEITDYSAITDGKTVCRGYAMLLYKLFTKAGITSHIVIGTLDGEGHAWNIVQVDGKWYHIDATNDDASNSSKYYMVSDSVLKRNGFAWDTKSVPVAAGDTKVDSSSLIDNATKLVEAAEKTNSINDELIAERAVSKLAPSDSKNSLVSRLNLVKIQIAKNAVATVEKNQTQMNLEIANRLVSSLPEGSDKTDLAKRINDVKQSILLNNATEMVKLAEKVKTRSAINVARQMVNKLNDSAEKTALINRLNSINVSARR